MKAFERKCLGVLLTAVGSLVVAPCARSVPVAPDPSARRQRDASLLLLKEGNTRYAGGKSQPPHLDAERRSSSMAQGREPFATVLACSASRKPAELIFDRGVGDLFVVRVAGNVAGASEPASQAETDDALARNLTHSATPVNAAAAQNPSAGPASTPLALTDNPSSGQGNAVPAPGSKHH